VLYLEGQDFVEKNANFVLGNNRKMFGWDDATLDKIRSEIVEEFDK
jgi:hypothetical protein